MRKTLQELTLLDKFLFDQTMDIPEAYEAALQIILGRDDLALLAPPEQIQQAADCMKAHPEWTDEEVLSGLKRRQG